MWWDGCGEVVWDRKEYGGELWERCGAIGGWWVGWGGVG